MCNAARGPGWTVILAAAMVSCHARATSTTTAGGWSTTSTAPATGRSCSSTGCCSRARCTRRSPRALAERGNRVICLDLLGHGESDRPRDMWRYSMPIFGEQIVALLDHLGSTRRSSAARRSARTRRSRPPARRPSGCAAWSSRCRCWTTRCSAARWRSRRCSSSLTFGAPITRSVAAARPARAARASPPGDVGARLDLAGPGPVRRGAPGALLRPRSRRRASERATIETPALVIGHGRDPIHPFSDSDMLVRELPNGRLLEASSLLELRVAPDRLTGEIAPLRRRVLAAGQGARRAQAPGERVAP